MLVKHPKFQTIALGGGSGLVIMGPTSCFIGGGVGVVIGSAVGVVPALFTLGLSIPVGAVIGGTGGLCTGTLIGGTTGGAAGLTAYRYRIQIKSGMMTIQVKAQNLMDSTKATSIKAYKGANSAVSARVFKLQVSVNSIASKAK